MAVSAQDNFLNGVSISDNDLGEADLFVTDNSVLDGNVCIGNGCTLDVTFATDVAVIVSDTNNGVIFDDTSSATYPDRDWKLLINDVPPVASGGLERFAIEDVTNGTIPFSVLGAAPENALVVASSGQVGLGTAIPQADLHISSADTADVLLAPTNAGVRSFQVGVDADGLFTRISTGAIPFEVANDSAFGALQILNSGVRVNAGNFDKDFQIGSDVNDNAMFVDGATAFVGFGTNSPEQLLHIRSDATGSDAFALFDANGTGSDAAFLLRQNGVTPTTWEFRNQQDSGRLNVGVAGGNTPLKIDNTANNNLLKLGRNGRPDEVVVTGKLVVNNTQMNVPDYVFAEDYALRPLSDVQAFIDANSHLPEVPSEAQIRSSGLDMAEMQLVHLKKIEELTLYTLEQEERITRLEAALEALVAE
jgi:hypothetical protein